MFRILAVLLLTASVSRWIYSEANLVAPRAVPYIDRLLEKTSIPTHDQWNKEAIEEAASIVGNFSVKLIESFTQTEQAPPKSAKVQKATRIAPKVVEIERY